MSAPNSTINRLQEAGIIAILRGKNPSKMFDRGIELVEMGCTAIEVTLDSKEPLQILQKLRTELPDSIILGVGTVDNRGQIQACVKAGASFALSPTFPEGMVEECQQYGILAIPGVSDFREFQVARKAGAEIVKLFPSTEWNLEQLEDVDIPWIPVGGVNHNSVWTWLDAGAWCIGMGSNLCGSDLNQDGADNKGWSEIEAQRTRDIFMELQRRHTAT